MHQGSAIATKQQFYVALLQLKFCSETRMLAAELQCLTYIRGFQIWQFHDETTTLEWL